MAAETLFEQVLRWHSEDPNRCAMPKGDAADALCAELDATRESVMRNIKSARSALAMLEPACAPSTEPAAVVAASPAREVCAPTMEIANEERSGVEAVDAGAPDKRDSFELDWDAREYVFNFRGQRWTAPFKEVARWAWWYPHQGDGNSAREVALRADEEHDRDLTEDWARRALRVMGILKSSPPFAPHELIGHTPAELSKLAQQRRQNAAERVLRRDEVKGWRDIARKAQRKLLDQDRIVEALVGALEQRPAPTLERVEVASTQTMAVVGLYDCHLGKRDTSGAGLDHSVDVMVSAVRKLAGRIASMHAPERIVVAVGGDFLHVDTIGATTTAGTAQDVDATSSRILAAGIDALITCVDTLAQLADVEVVIIPGNHDRILASAVMLAVSRHYAQRDGVEVQVHHSTRAYVRYGRTLLGFEHGDGPKPADLATIMSTERAADWGATTCKAWLVGHLHHVHEREVAGCHVLQAPSLAGADAWHSRKGYVTSTRALRAYLFDRVEGMVGQVQVGA